MPVLDESKLTNADELVEWTRRWMSALPLSVRRPLQAQEIAVLRKVFSLRLAGEEVSPDKLNLTSAMSISRLFDQD
ncbi:MAG: hypothetical protein JSS66_03065 [Armatimonadetes bacterium]|nr:hypothetical protein [Armatimonadota bacterium]